MDRRRRRRPTLADVAGRAGVSTALVSIVMRQAPGASAATRQRVITAAEEPGHGRPVAARVTLAPGHLAHRGGGRAPGAAARPRGSRPALPPPGRDAEPQLGRGGPPGKEGPAPARGPPGGNPPTAVTVFN